MADNVIRRDVVQIGFDIENSPIGDLQKLIDKVEGSAKELATSVDGSTKELVDMEKTLKKAAAVSSDMDDLNKSVQKTADNAKELEVRFSEMVKALAGSVMTKARQLPKVIQSSSTAAKKFASMLRSAVPNGIKKAVSQAQKLQKAFNKIRSIKVSDVVKKLDKSLGKAVLTAKKLPRALKTTAMNTLVTGATKLRTGFSKTVTSAKSLFSTLRKSSSEMNAISGVAGKLSGVLAAAGIGASVTGAVSGISEMQQASNKFQAQTGVSTPDMSGYNKAIKSMYTDALGESMIDVSDSMARIMQTTGFEGKALENTTRNALLLRDTFDFDVQESIRSVDMMMKQFNVSADEAYSMIAQGAQNGLNKNNDLLDTVNEYSVHFKQLGFDADEMFNMLVNGVESGTFSVDKLGDTVKEFGIRAVDGSETTATAFASLGLNADTMAQRFKAGGESGKQAFADTIAALKAMDDPVKREAAGVALFGTMWEDLGAEGVFALSNITGEITGTTDALEKINKVRYNDIGTAFESLKRKASVALNTAMLPMLNKVIDLADKFKEWAKEVKLVDKLKTTFSELKVAAEPVITAIGGIVKGFAEFLTSEKTVNSLKKAFEVMKKVLKPIGAVLQFLADNMDVLAPIIMGVVIALTAFSVVMGIVNAVMAVSPITWIILAIVALIAIIVLCVKHWDTIKAAMVKVWEKIKEVFGKLGEWFMTNVVNPIVNFFVGLWNKIVSIFTAIKTAITTAFVTVVTWISTNVIQPIVNFFTGLWTTITGIFGSVVSWFSEKFSAAVEAIKSVFGSIVEFFSGIWESIKSTFTEIGTNIGNAIGEAFATVVNAIIGFAENTINGFIKAINLAIGLINEIPGVEIPLLTELAIPRLAKGGVVDKPTIAQIGEQGKEAVVPLENNTGWIKKVVGGVAAAISSSKPVSTSEDVVTTNSSRTEYNTYSPQFTVNLNGASATEDNKRKVQKWIREVLDEYFDDLDKSNSPIIEI